MEARVKATGEIVEVKVYKREHRLYIRTHGEKTGEIYRAKDLDFNIEDGNTSDYCDYETCVALKKLGYNEKTLAYYTSEGFFHWIRAYIYDVAIPDLANSSNKKQYKHIIDAMSLYEAQKWLREVKKLHITIHSQSQESWQYRITKPHQKFEDGLHGEDFSSFEEALSEGIKEALNTLK